MRAAKGKGRTEGTERESTEQKALESTLADTHRPKQQQVEVRQLETLPWCSPGALRVAAPAAL